MTLASKVVYNYLRTKKKFPHVWCPGCGIGIAMGALLRSLADLETDKNDVVMVSGIGCTGRMPVYCDFNTLHTTHGRALAFATGVKIAKPRLKVIAVVGDGDGLAIGGNHFIHAARRNIDITVLLVNNKIYGMTGGQYSPTTPWQKIGSTAPHGNVEHPFDVHGLTKGAGATYFARGTVYHAAQMQTLLRGALENKGFSVVEVMSNCHTLYGRLNREGSAVKMIEWMKTHSVNVKAAEKKTPEELEDKFITGVLWQDDRPEYCEQYENLIVRLGGRPKSSEHELELAKHRESVEKAE
ncbi:MAG: 2-oxoacid:ferredoxin oxidoreductase subunit beta [candidate division Zixibacteria bacterium]|nr:2-oxoacid:ferredoxin oxidoreductase subunit beta [candidate division Zixibacteria bacterium]